MRTIDVLVLVLVLVLGRSIYESQFYYPYSCVPLYLWLRIGDVCSWMQGGTGRQHAEAADAQLQACLSQYRAIEFKRFLFSGLVAPNPDFPPFCGLLGSKHPLR